MELTPDMFNGRNLRLSATVPDRPYAEIYMLPEEAIRLLLRLRSFRRKADRDGQLAFWAFDDRDSRIGWARNARNVELYVRRDEVVWKFEADTEVGTVSITTWAVKRDELLAALLEAARPEAFRQEFRDFAENGPEDALEALEEWLDLDSLRARSKTIVPLTEEDLVPILDAEDPDVRQRAMSALGRLDPDAGDDLRSDAA